MMGRRLPVKDEDEFDVVTGWRRVRTTFKRAGAASKEKRRIRRRERRAGKREEQA